MCFAWPLWPKSSKPWTGFCRILGARSSERWWCRWESQAWPEFDSWREMAFFAWIKPCVFRRKEMYSSTNFRYILSQYFFLLLSENTSLVAAGVVELYFSNLRSHLRSQLWQRCGCHRTCFLRIGNAPLGNMYQSVPGLFSEISCCKVKSNS